jgi:hypothetical protein
VPHPQGWIFQVFDDGNTLEKVVEVVLKQSEQILRFVFVVFED